MKECASLNGNSIENNLISTKIIAANQFNSEIGSTRTLHESAILFGF